MSSQPLHQMYGDQMRDHPYGYALYNPTSSAVLKPGAVGYFDDLGYWNPLANLADASSLTERGLKLKPFPQDELYAAKQDESMSWGPKLSKTVREHRMHFSGGVDVSATGLPVNAKIQIKYTSSSDFGAVLVTASPIVHRAYHYQSPFSNWVKDNAEELFFGARRQEVKEHGLFVITQTFATTKCSITAWKTPQSEVFLGFDIGTMGAGLESSGIWYEGRSSSGWNSYQSTANDLVVVFVCGLWFRCNRRLFKSQLRLEEKPIHYTRGSATIEEPVQIIVDEGVYDIECEVFGKPPETKDADDDGKEKEEEEEEEEDDDDDDE